MSTAVRYPVENNTAGNQLPNENRFHRFFSSERESFATSVLWYGALGRIPWNVGMT
jgi:hypothetical protein